MAFPEYGLSTTGDIAYSWDRTVSFRHVGQFLIGTLQERTMRSIHDNAILYRNLCDEDAV